MRQDKLESLKRKIKRTYKQYNGESTDGEATLIDVAKFFSIPIKPEKVGDYIVKEIDFNTPSIVIYDTREDITYTATYTSNANLLNCSGGEMRFISVISTNPVRKEEILYYIGDKNPIITRMIFTDGEYELAFEREMPNSAGFFVKHETRMVIEYLKSISYRERTVKQHLLTKVFHKDCRDGVISCIFENIFTYLPEHYIKWKDRQDKYIHMRNNSVIYGINECEKSGVCNYLRAICFESTKVSELNNYLPFNIDTQYFPSLMAKEVVSAIIFRVGTGAGIHHTLEVYKKENTMFVAYNAEFIRCKEATFSREFLADEKFDLPVLVRGTISVEEIQNLIVVLQEKFGEKGFPEIITEELNTFATKIGIRKGSIQEENDDPLAPKLFIDQSFDEICEYVNENREECFRLIGEQFAVTTNIDIQEKDKTNVITPKEEQPK